MSTATQILRIAVLAFCLACPAVVWGQLPRDPSELLIIGDSFTAGTYFLELDSVGVRQSWAGQLVRRLGFEAPRAPYGQAFPINHPRLAQNGLGFAGVAYLWEARRAFLRGRPQFDIDDERIVLAIPGQTVREVLEQSSKTKALNKGSTGWTFANVLLPEGLSAIETVEQWDKRPRWVVLVIGANDVLASFGMAGDALPPTPNEFRAQFAELAARLRARMPSDAPPAQLLLLTVPDVTTLPFIQELEATADNGHGVPFPKGSKASTFLIPFRSHFQDDEVWTPDELAVIHRRVVDYNQAIIEIAKVHGYTVVDIKELMLGLAEDPGFASPRSPYFSPDLHHPSYRAHEAMANQVIEAMALIVREPVPPPLATEAPLPSAADLDDPQQRRTNALMHLAVQGLEAGPLPPRLTSRLALEMAGQGGEESVGEAVLSVMAGVEFPATPISTRHVARLGLSARATIAALQSSNEDTDFFPKRSAEARLGFGFEKIGMWNWSRLELGGLLTLDRYRDGGMYVRGEWRMLYADVSSRGWDFDRFEAGIRFGLEQRRPGRNGN